MKKSTVGILAGLAIAATSGLIIASKKGRKFSNINLDDDKKENKKSKKENVGIIRVK